MEEEKIGNVVKFFAKLSVAAIEITKGTLKVGDVIHITGHTTDFEEKVESMQIENKSVEKAGEGQLVGVKVKERVRQNDQVFKVSE